MTMLLIPTMMFMWLISGLFIWGLVPPINYVRTDDRDHYKHSILIQSVIISWRLL